MQLDHDIHFCFIKGLCDLKGFENVNELPKQIEHEILRVRSTFCAMYFYALAQTPNFHFLSFFFNLNKG